MQTRSRSGAAWARMTLIAVLGVMGVTASSCTRRPGRGEEARQHFLKVAEALKTGGLATTFSAALSPGHQADLNGLLIDARELLTAEEFETLKAMVARAGPKLGSLCALASAKSPALGVLGAKAKDLPAALGLDTFESFKARDVKGILEALDRGLVVDLLKSSDVKSRVDSLEVKVVQQEGDWAKLRFQSKAPDGSATEEEVDVIAQGDRWLPAGWVNDWVGTMDNLRAQVARLKEAKKEDPNLVKKGLAELSKMLDDPTAIFALFSPRKEGGKAAE